jgi:hypothetical protein
MRMIIMSAPIALLLLGLGGAEGHRFYNELLIETCDGSSVRNAWRWADSATNAPFDGSCGDAVMTAMLDDENGALLAGTYNVTFSAFCGEPGGTMTEVSIYRSATDCESRSSALAGPFAFAASQMRGCVKTHTGKDEIHTGDSGFNMSCPWAASAFGEHISAGSSRFASSSGAFRTALAFMVLASSL